MKIVLYKDRRSEYRWRLVAKNGRILADCAEGYKEKRKMMLTVGKILMKAMFVLVDKTGMK